MATTDSNEPTIAVAKTELDSHEDITVAAENCTALYFIEWACDPKKGIALFHTENGYTLACGRNYILIFIKSLCIP